MKCAECGHFHNGRPVCDMVVGYTNLPPRPKLYAATPMLCRCEVPQ